MTRGRTAVAFCVSLAFAATAFAQKVSTEFDEKVDFSKFKTFAIREGQMRSLQPALNNELTKKRVETAIERALVARGLTKADGPSDLNVFFTVASRPVTEREAYPTGARGLGTRVERVPAFEGSLIVGLRDPTTRSLVWQGIASDEKSSPVDLSKKLDDMVKKVIEKYPPKK